MIEEPVVFTCEGECLVGVLSRPESTSSTGVLIVVGGPQYRVGSHRQFVLLARALANAGHPCLRFDYRGMGDSSGERRTFESVDADLAAAIEAFRRRMPTVRRLVIFGLCDAASAALMSACKFKAVSGLILANPWVRRPESHNAAVVRHYYARRLLSGAFWRDLLAGRVSLLRSTREGAGRVLELMRSRLAQRAPSGGDFVTRMRSGWQHFSGDRLLILSERDLTAKEFEHVFGTDPAWSRVPGTATTTVRLIRGADHTFSNTEHRVAVENACIEFMNAAR